MARGQNNTVLRRRILIAPALLPSACLSAIGGTQKYANMMPYQALNWIIALQGIFPVRS